MSKRRLGALLVAAIAATAAVVLIIGPAGGGASIGPQISLVATGGPQTGEFTPSGSGDLTLDEFPTGDDEDEGPDPYGGTISFSSGAGGGPSVNSGKKAKSNPTFNFGFQGQIGRAHV